jgi:hypothetical protein
MQIAMASADRTLRRCLVCGSSEIRTDEVIDRGVLLLAECRHCDRRWTGPPEPTRAPLVVRVRPVRREFREVAGAA